ncbi:hypothetical protein PG995_006693 [Apiospora arundinis]
MFAARKSLTMEATGRIETAWMSDATPLAKTSSAFLTATMLPRAVADPQSYSMTYPSRAAGKAFKSPLPSSLRSSRGPIS